MAEYENVENVILEPKLIGDIKGEFIIPEYQRGYRWTKEHINMLLNDIWENGDANYSLQPIVVKRLDDGKFELIDGQQRLTTLFLIIRYMEKLLPNIVKLKYSLNYSTRDRCEDFLSTLNDDLAKDNIDFFHIYNAYQTIETWFDEGEPDKGLKAINLYKYFGEKVKVIWYETDKNENAIDLFTRLNIGKIPLTNAELVKALFLSQDNENISDEKQLEIATSWDIIEKELNDDSFWTFLTNEPTSNYATRIELIFNMMANKKEGNREKLFTFFYFLDEMKENSKIEIWRNIQAYFLLLKEWYNKREIYHKVGYLIAIGEKMQNLVDQSKDLTKSAFQETLDNKIINKLDLTSDEALGLSYNNKNDRAIIENLLLLFNVEAIRILQNTNEKFPFEFHKQKSWSLEHIHAQNSEGLNKVKDQQQWLMSHKKSLLDLMIRSDHTELIEEVIKKIDENYENITKAVFDVIFAEVFALLSEDEDRDYIDSITNMALLGTADNTALNNSTFDVKRNKILEMDKNGDYIPICTRRVFLKYYTESKDNQLQFWGEADRTAYIEEMTAEKGMLYKYLKQSSNNI